MQRVMIVGSGGAGKTTFANRLGETLGLPVVHLDAACNGTNHTGGGRLAATAKVGIGPFGAVVNNRTHTSISILKATR